MTQTALHKKDSLASRIDQLMDNPHCERCGGLMVATACLDIEDPTGQLWFDARHCVQCGNVIDPVILKNQEINLMEHREENHTPRPRPSYAVSLKGRKTF